MTSIRSSAVQDSFGIALSSPGLCSPGLDGEQGWSPSSSIFSFPESDDGDREQVSTKSKRDQRRHTWAWPLPPVRIPATRPLSIGNKQRNSLNALSPRLMMSRGGSTSSESTSSAATTLIDDRPVHYRLSPRNAMIEKFANLRRHVSAPAPDISSLDTIYDQTETIPLMPMQLDLFKQNFDWQAEEKVKMDRLQASFSLLGVENGLKAGHYSTYPSSLPSMSPDSSPTSNSTYSAEEVDDNHASPTAGLCLLRMTLSPEHKAPTLAEQMAFASGLGNLCSWASPMKHTYASSDDYLRFMQSQQPQMDCVSPGSDLLFSETESLPVPNQEDRKHASRHIRQNVAANAAHRRSVGSIQAFGYEEEEETEEEQDDDVEQRERFIKATMNASQSVGYHSAISANSSPILHGALSATSFDSITVASSTVASSSIGSDRSDIASPSTCPSSLPSSDAGTPTILKAVPVTTVSPILADEFAYLAQNDAFLMSMGNEDEKAIRSYWPDSNGFNGCTLSPCLTTPELELAESPLTLLPSPNIEPISIKPTCVEYVDDSREIDQSEISKVWLPNSSSFTSILERPRPIPSSSSNSFFGQSDIAKQRIVSNKSKAKRIVSQKASIELSADVFADQSNDDDLDHNQLCIPKRKESLTMDKIPNNSRQSMTKSATCVSFKDEPHPRHLLQSYMNANTESNGMTTSVSMGTLGPKALEQVREACRLKAIYSRNPSFEVKSAPPVPSIPKELRPKSILSSYKSEPVKLSVNSKRSPQKGNSENIRMPTLFVARTPDQRKSGQTGIPETEPRNLALAKLGFKTENPTRHSTVRALSSSSSSYSSRSRSNSMMMTTTTQDGMPLTIDEMEDQGILSPSLSVCADLSIDPTLHIAAELHNNVQGNGMPKDFVLIVEESQTVISNVLVA